MTIANEEQMERKRLVGFCEHCQEWYAFVLTDEDSRLCPECGGRPSSRIGFQITTQRTFNPKAKKLSKAQLKKIGGS